MRLVVLVVVVLALSAGSGAARTSSATVGVYPSGTTFAASSAAPAHATPTVSLAMRVGGVDDATSGSPTRVNFVDWTALEGITGLLYGQGTTTYAKGDPLVSNDKENGLYRARLSRAGHPDYGRVARSAQARRRRRRQATPVGPLLDEARLHCRLPDQDVDAVLVADVVARRDAAGQKIAQMRAAALHAAS